MIKAVIFDLGNVIVPFDFKRAYARIEPLTKYAAAEIPARLRATDLVHRFETGRVSSERFVEELAALLDFKMTHSEFREVWSSIFLPGTLVSESLLTELAGRYTLLVLSNTNPIHFEMVRANYPELRHFHHYVLSHEVGAKKPSARIYQEAISRAGCLAGECFFTDDLLINVEAARQQGMDAVQFESGVQLERELGLRGLL
jgi:FMN phosphatase YigB (HAD superfamily)